MFFLFILIFRYLLFCCLLLFLFVQPRHSNIFILNTYSTQARWIICKVSKLYTIFVVLCCCYCCCLLVFNLHCFSLNIIVALPLVTVTTVTRVKQRYSIACYKHWSVQYHLKNLCWRFLWAMYSHYYRRICFYSCEYPLVHTQRVFGEQSLSKHRDDQEGKSKKCLGVQTVRIFKSVDQS